MHRYDDPVGIINALEASTARQRSNHPLWVHWQKTRRALRPRMVNTTRWTEMLDGKGKLSFVHKHIETHALSYIHPVRGLPKGDDAEVEES